MGIAWAKVRNRNIAFQHSFPSIGAPQARRRASPPSATNSALVTHIPFNQTCLIAVPIGPVGSASPSLADPREKNEANGLIVTLAGSSSLSKSKDDPPRPRIGQAGHLHQPPIQIFPRGGIPILELNSNRSTPAGEGSAVAAPSASRLPPEDRAASPSLPTRRPRVSRASPPRTGHRYRSGRSGDVHPQHPEAHPAFASDFR
jgi:hypothetical protein